MNPGDNKVPYILGIKTASRGVILDGQHRLQAIKDLVSTSPVTMTPVDDTSSLAPVEEAASGNPWTSDEGSSYDQASEGVMANSTVQSGRSDDSDDDEDEDPDDETEDH